MVENDLSQGFVPALLQGSDGFIWIATLDGLNRFDGVSVKVFREDAARPKSLDNNTIYNVLEDSRKRLWVVTELGLGIFDRQTLAYHRVWSPMAVYGNPIASTPRLMLAEADDRLWCIYGDTVYRLSWPKATFEPEKLTENLEVAQFTIPQGQYGTILALAIIDGSLWLGTTLGVVAQPLHGPLGTFDWAPDVPRREAIAIWRDTFGIWVQGQNDITLARPAKGQARFTRPIEANGAHGNLHGLHYQGRTYFFSRDRIYCWDGTQLSILPEVFPEGILSAYLATNGQFWIGTNARGVRSFFPDQFRFPVLLRGESQQRQPVYDAAGRLWLFSPPPDVPGYRLFDELTGRFKERLIPQRHESILPVRDGGFWTLTNNYALARIYPDGTTRRWAAGYLPPSGFLRQLLADQQGFIWFPVQGARLRRFDPVQEQFADFDFGYCFDDDGLNVQIQLLNCDSSGRLWLGTNMGLLRIDRLSDGSFQAHRYHSTAAPGRRLSNNRIQSITIDPQQADVLWIGTQHGLNRLEIASGIIKQFTTQEGLVNDVISSLLPVADSPYLWMGTNRGLFEFNTERFSWRHFTTQEGLPGAEFNRYATAITPDGRLIFGSVEGFVIVDPATIQRSTRRPDIRLTGLAVDNQWMEPNDGADLLTLDVGYQKALRLEHYQNNLELSFALLDFRRAADNRYEYRLLGVDSVWVSIGKRHQVNFSNLAPGRYVFEVRGCNFEGIWSAPASLPILIKAPWWQRWWAYTAYFMVAVGLIALGFRIWSRQVRLRYRLTLQHQEAVRLKDLDQFKSRVFSNITHEFRTPLTVMLGMAEKIESGTEGEIRERAAIISRNGINLLQLTRQLLDLARLDAQRLELLPEPGELGDFIRLIGQSLETLAVAKEIDLSIETPAQPVWTYFDPLRLRDIVTNLISNAIKFTPAGGTVSMTLDLEPNDQLRLSVADSGIGIAPDVHERIFERFFQVENMQNNTGGSGIGLTYVRELVTLIGGTIEVTSEPGLGSIFTVRWPYRPAEPPSDVNGSVTSSITPQPVDSRWPSSAPQRDDRPLILLIEDNTDVAHFIADCLADSYALIREADGQNGLEKALELVPDLVITDVMLPGLDGYQVCEGMKSDVRTSHVPIVMLTACDDYASRLEGLRRGADVYLTKPFRRDELLLHLQNLSRHALRLRKHYRTLAEETATTTEQPPPDAVREEEAFVRQVLEIIEQHYQDPEFGVNDIQRAVMMSSSQLHRKLTALTGKPAGFYLRQIRLERARHDLLERNNQSIAVIALANGFRDPNYFSRAFTQEYGKTPSDYRQEQGR